MEHDLTLSGAVLAHRELLKRLVWMVTAGDAKGEALLKDGVVASFDTWAGDVDEATFSAVKASAAREIEKIIS